MKAVSHGLEILPQRWCGSVYRARLHLDELCWSTSRHM